MKFVTAVIIVFLPFTMGTVSAQDQAPTATTPETNGGFCFCRYTESRYRI